MKSAVAGRDLSTKVRRSVQSGKQISAIVQEVYFDHATVRLAGNGQLMRNLAVIGGPVEEGQAVSVDFSTTPPQIVAIGKSGLSADDLANALKRTGDSTLTGDLVISIILFSGGSSVDIFTPNADGLNSALIAANDGDVIWLPDVEISADITVGAGVTLAGISSRESIIFGTVTLGDNSVLETLKIVATAYYDDTKAVQVTALEKQAVIRNCEIHAYQCVDGSASAIVMDAAALLELDHTLVVGYAAAASAYAIEFVTGSIVNAAYSRFWATTSWFTGTGTVNEYANTEGFEESLFWCEIPAPAYFPYYEGVYGTGQGAPVPGEDKNGIVLLSPTDEALRTDNANSYGAKGFQRRGDYIYFSIYVASGQHWVREFKISDGTTIDLQVPNLSDFLGQFVVVDDRKVLATAHADASLWNVQYLYIYLLDFGASSVTVEHQFYNKSEPVEYYHQDFTQYLKHSPIVTKNTAGDVLVAVTGKVYFMDSYGAGGLSFTSKIGYYVLTKNWTQDGAWTMHTGQAFANGLNYWDEKYRGDTYPASLTHSDNGYMAMVSQRYLVIQVDIDRVYEGTQSSHLSNPINDAWIGMWVYDFDTEALTFTYEHFEEAGIWGDGLQPVYFGADHQNSLLFITAYAINTVDDFLPRVWKFDPVNETIGIHYTGDTEDTDVSFVGNNTRCYLMVSEDGIMFLVLDAATLATINPEFTDPNFHVFNALDRTLDNNNNYLWSLDVGGNVIIGHNLVDATSESFDPSFTIENGFSNAKVICLGEVFVVLDHRTSGGYYWKIVRNS